MKRLILVALLFVPVVFLADLAISIVHAHLFNAQIGGGEILPTLCKKIRHGMRRSEVEHRIDGFRETRREPRDQGYAIAYGYWFGFIPPLGSSEFKLIGKVVVSYSSETRAVECSFWYN